ncbi:MAG TPA: mechanosensitive ion channel [Ferruginibacter sp.]|nr:mechanosensitive ion channel [Ferruginibacter sp.]
MYFLETLFLDNTLKSYGIVLGTIAFVLLFKRLLSHYVASLLFLFVKNHWKTIQKKEFISLIIKPLAWFITISISVFAIDKLIFPEAWKFTIYGHPTEEILEKIGKCLIVLYFIWFVLSLINFVALIFEQKAKTTKDKRDDQLIVFFRDFLKVIVVILGILLLIKAGFNQDVGTVLTGLSIVGAAMALAAKESLENLIASFIIFFDKPFFTGDTLKVNNVTGTVEHIGLRSTRIRTADKTLVTVPNKQMVDSVVDNFSMRTQRRAELKLEFSAKTNTPELENFIQSAKKMLSEKQDVIEKYSVFFSEYNKNGITITIEYFTIHFSMTEFNQLKETINIELKKQIESLGLEMASAGSDINIFSGDANTGQSKSQPII